MYNNYRNDLEVNVKAVGIITEYNPMHEGHIIHINESRRMSGADIVICVMSGDYVQRGEPAIIDKYSRAKMAVLNGVDLVVELPVQASLSSAETFAEQSVQILHILGVDSICFGCEDSDINDLNMIASLLIDEPDNFRQHLTKLLSSGESYASARQKAVELCIGCDKAAVLEKPNNTLGIEYIKAVKKYGYDMKPMCIKRDGAGYNDASYEKDIVPSATAVRNAILDDRLDDIALPPLTRKVLDDSTAYPVVFNDFTSMFYYRLEMLIAESAYDKEAFIDKLLNIRDISRETAARIYNLYNKMTASDTVYPLDEFALLIKTKQYALSRIKRIIMKIILNIGKSDTSEQCSYIRILGFNQNGRKYLSYIRDSVNVPLISRVAGCKDIYYKQIQAHNIYRQICECKFNKAPVSDYKYHPFMTD